MGIDAKMFVRSKKVYSEKEVLNLAYKIACAFGTDKFSILRDGSYKRHCLQIVQEYCQDGDSIYPENGEQLIRVNLSGRFYGPGYERGPIQNYIAIAEYLERNISGASIWYGGDSSGVCAAPFGKDVREKMWQHFCDVGHDPYIGSFDQLPISDPKRPFCDFCQKPMIQYGWGKHYSAFCCNGCGLKMEFKEDPGVSS